MYIQPFTTLVDWPEMGCLMEVSIMFRICRYCVFTWNSRYKLLSIYSENHGKMSLISSMYISVAFNENIKFAKTLKVYKNSCHMA